MVAVDFGASSIRVCRVDLGARPPAVEVVHRHGHGPVTDGAGHLRWDWARLVAEMDAGLAAAVARGPVASIGVDTWGVDYGLLDDRGELVAPPFSYRDDRTAGYATVVAAAGGPAALYATTGVQLQAFNTIFQVAAHDRSELARARHLVLLPELLVHHLTGAILAERTSAGTTGLVDITAGDWSADLAAAAGLDPALLPPIAAAGERAGAVARDPGPPGRRPRHRLGRGGHGRRSRPARGVRVGGDLAARRPRAGRARPRRGGAGRQLHQRDRGPRRRPVPEEPGRVLADRGVPARLGRPAGRRPVGGGGRRGRRSCPCSTWPTSASSTRPTCWRR